MSRFLHRSVTAIVCLILLQATDGSTAPTRPTDQTDRSIEQLLLYLLITVFTLQLQRALSLKSRFRCRHSCRHCNPEAAMAHCDSRFPCWPRVLFVCRGRTAPITSPVGLRSFTVRKVLILGVHGVFLGRGGTDPFPHNHYAHTMLSIHRATAPPSITIWLCVVIPASPAYYMHPRFAAPARCS